jgi:hypothetical protein
MANNTVNTKTPNAAVFIYNYSDRLGSDAVTKDDGHFAIDQIILNSASLISVSTQKSKGNPAGAFEIRLAPTKNWVTAITPGSWCLILMSNEKINDAAKYGGDTVDEKSFKMLGRIESVRSIINTDQGTGARSNQYVVTGSDWGCIFNANFYVDPVSRPKDISAVGMAERFGYDEYLKKNLSGFNSKVLGPKKLQDDYFSRPDLNKNVQEGRKKTANFLNQFKKRDNYVEEKRTDDKPGALPNATKNIDFLLSFWGQDDSQTSALGEGSDGKILAKAKQKFKLPKKLAQYMRLRDKNGKPSSTISQVLTQKSGKLSGYDKYTDNDRSAGLIDFNSIFGTHTMWELINSNTNFIMNEVIPEIRFENGLPKLTVYNRVKPFCINDKDKLERDGFDVDDKKGAKQSDKIKNFYSQYKNVRRKMIDSNDVIMCNYGTNWRDRINFVEINLSRNLFQEAFSPEIKLDSQFSDPKSISRDGLLSMIVQGQYVPLKDDGNIDPLSIFVYKTLLKEWHFDTHKMFNGSMYLIGQDQYIQVGDNIMVESKVVNLENFNNNAEQKSTRTKTYLLAHVQSVQHEAKVGPNGARVFTTTIDFVRGILTDVNGNIIVTDGISGAVDQDGSKTSPSVERNKQTFGTSTANDVDRQQLNASKIDRGN